MTIHRSDKQFLAVTISLLSAQRAITTNHGFKNASNLHTVANESIRTITTTSFYEYIRDARCVKFFEISLAL